MIRRLSAALAVTLLLLLAALPAAAQIEYTAPAGGTFTGGTITSPILAPAADNCASVPYSFTGETGTGVCLSGTNKLTFRVGGFNYYAAQGSEFTIGQGVPIGFSSGDPKTITSDLFLYRDAANTLAQRNGTNAQKFNLYGGYTGPGDYGRGVLTTTTPGIFEITTESVGVGPYLALGLSSASGYVLMSGIVAPYAWATDTAVLGIPTQQWKELHLTRSIQGSKTKALTEGAATAVTQIAVPQTAGSNSADAVVQWTVYASDGTDTQTLRGSTYLAAVNKAGTETCTVGDIGTPVVAVSAGTLTCTTSCITGLTDVVQFALDCTSSLTQTSLNALVRLDMDQPNTVTPQ